jgi:RNA polymerase sigma-70 factor (ECF subfamily)
LEAFGLTERITHVSNGIALERTMTNAATPNDADLLSLMLAGDDEAFTALYRRHQGRVYRFAFLMSGSAHTAEEVTQEVFLYLIREARRYDSSLGSLPAYLLGVARNHVLRILERERAYTPLGEDLEASRVPLTKLIALDDPFRNCTRNEVISLVRRAVLALPTRYREVIVLCDFEEQSYAEAALALDCPIGTVNSRLHRGHALLLKKLRAASELYSAESDAQGMRCFV